MPSIENQPARATRQPASRRSTLDQLRLRDLAKIARIRRAAGKTTIEFERHVLTVAAPALGALPALVGGLSSAARWAQAHCPLLFDSIGPVGVATMVARPGRRLSALAVGNLLEITKAERAQLDRPTIRAAGMTNARMKAQRRRANRERKRKQATEARGKKAPRLTVAERCRALGISPATYYRRRAREVAQAAKRPTEGSRGSALGPHQSEIVRHNFPQQKGHALLSRDAEKPVSLATGTGAQGGGRGALGAPPATPTQPAVTSAMRGGVMGGGAPKAPQAGRRDPAPVFSPIDAPPLGRLALATLLAAHRRGI